MRILVQLIVVAMAALLLPYSVSAQAPQDEVVYYHLDAVGSIRATTDGGGQTVERLDYLPFGEPWPTQGAERLQFTGAQRDPSTGFTYLMARYLFVNAGRFTSPDSAVYSDGVNPQSWNLYVYVTNRPLTFIDPSGHEECVNMSTNTTATVICPWAWEQIMQNLIAVSQRYPPRIAFAGLLVPPPPAQVNPAGPAPLPPCTSLTIQGDIGSISVQQSPLLPGRVQWGVTIDKRVVGTLVVAESFREVGKSRRSTNVSRPYLYTWTGGTTHGSRGNLQPNSEYVLGAILKYPPNTASGALACRVQ
jgi:RHS repeat-associated protein